MISEGTMRTRLAEALNGQLALPFSGDLDELIAAAESEGVLALLAAGWATASPPCSASMLSAHRLEAMRELARQAQAREVLSLLDRAEIPVLTLKGAALAYGLYPSPEQRSRCDLDLLVASREQARRAVSVLLDAGYVLLGGVDVDASTESEVALVCPLSSGYRVAIDLHWALINHSVLSFGLSFERLWAQRLSLPALHPKALGLGRTHALLHALLHRITNFAHGNQDRLIWLYDIRLLTAEGGVDWNEFIDLCSELCVAFYCLDGLLAASRIFNAGVPDCVLETLHSLAADEPRRLGFAPDQGMMDRAQLGALPWCERIGWLRRKLFPSREFMRHRYGAVGTIALTRAYLLRWWVGVKRGFGGC